MAQSNLYSATGTAETTAQITSDDTRDLGNVDVKKIIENDVNVTDDSTRALGQTTVTNQLGVDIEGQTLGPLATDIAQALSANAADELRITSPSPLDVSDSPVGVKDTSNTAVDPATEGTLASAETTLSSVDSTIASVDTTLGNRTGLNTFAHSTAGTAAEQLPPNTVPDGIEVLIVAKPGNSGRVYVGDGNLQPIPLEPDGAASLAVSNTDAIHIQTPTAGDGVEVIYEQ